MSNRSGQKGSKFDMWVARELSIWYFGKEHPDALIKTHGSRGRKHFKDQAGDLGIAKANLPKNWVFSVEDKHRDVASGPKRKTVEKHAWSFDDILLSKPKSAVPLFEYWEQCFAESKKFEKLPLLVCKRNYAQPVVGVSTYDFQYLMNHTVVQRAPTPTIKVSTGYRMITFFRFSDLLQTDPQTWIDRWEERYGTP